MTPVAISHAPLHQLEAFKQRMRWTFKWLSAANTDFNYDYHVSFRPERAARGEIYHNYRQKKSSPTEVGVSVFHRDPRDNILRTYSCYERGLDMLNAGYHLLDLVPMGRDEDGLPLGPLPRQLRGLAKIKPLPVSPFSDASEPKYLEYSFSRHDRGATIKLRLCG